MSKARHAYTKEDDDQMKAVVRTLNGNPANVSYWNRVVKIVKYFNEFSGNSLRSHWRLIDDRAGTMQGAKISWNFNNEDLHTDTESNHGHPVNYRQNNTKIRSQVQEKTPRKLNYPRPKPSQKIDPSEKKAISPKPDLKKFSDLFEDLVDLCCKIKGEKVPETQVLKVLIEQQGVVSDTLNFFEHVKFN